MRPYRFEIVTLGVDPEPLGAFPFGTDAEAIDFGKGIVADLLKDAKAYIGCVVRISEAKRNVCRLAVVENTRTITPNG